MTSRRFATIIRAAATNAAALNRINVPGSGIGENFNVPSPLAKVASELRNSYIAVPSISVNPCAPTKAPVPPVVVSSAVTPNGGSPIGGPGGPVVSPWPTIVPKILSAGFARFVKINVPVKGNGGTGPKVSVCSAVNSLLAKRVRAPVAFRGMLTTKQLPGGPTGAPGGILQVAVNA